MRIAAVVNESRHGMIETRSFSGTLLRALVEGEVDEAKATVATTQERVSYHVAESYRLKEEPVQFPEPAWPKEVAPEASGITQPGLGDGLGETRTAILAAMRANPTISRSMLADQLSVSTTAIDKHLEGAARGWPHSPVGPAKGGHWEVLS